MDGTDRIAELLRTKAHRKLKSYLETAITIKVDYDKIPSVFREVKIDGKTYNFSVLLEKMIAVCFEHLKERYENEEIETFLNNHIKIVESIKVLEQEQSLGDKN